MENQFNIQQAISFYAGLGMDAIPLRPGEKLPLHKGWHKKDPRRLWQSVPNDTNIGLRGGGDIGAAFLDCDDKNKVGTFGNVKRYLSGLGINEPPIVQTASIIGRHFYFSVTGAPEGHSCNLIESIGAGEFRYGPGAFVVAAPSTVEGQCYKVISGSFYRIPSILYSDLRPILGKEKTNWAPTPAIPRNAYGILNGDANAISQFGSRSEAEQSLLQMLANKDFLFPDVLDLFNAYPCAGKYCELRTANPKNAYRWLNHSYSRAQQVALKDSKEREIIKRAIAWARSQAWPDRGGPGELAVFLAHMAIAYKAGTTKGWAASKRDLADLAGVSEASKITKRLLLANRIILERQSTVDCANVYSLGTALPLPKDPFCEEVVMLRSNQKGHDAFRTIRILSHTGKRKTLGLGKVGQQIWATLNSQSMTEEELVKHTGRSLPTVKKYLEKMARLVDHKTGEILSMVVLLPTAEGEKWHALKNVDLNRVAIVVGTNGKGEKQQLRHAEERREHSRSLMAGSKNKK